MAEHWVAQAEEVPEGQVVLAHVDGCTVGVFRFRGRLYAYENRCLHQGGPVCLGEIAGRVVVDVAPDRTIGREHVSEGELQLVCPWHAWAYDLETGECTADRNLRLRRFSALERDGAVYVRAD